MIRGLYTAASGMIMEQTRNDTIANNLANVNTAGYKKDVAVFQSFPEMLLSRIGDGENTSGKATEKTQRPPVIGTIGTGVRVDGILQIHQQGAIRQTGAPLDLAIGGEGFFVVATPQGERYTRNGVLSLNEQGYLVTAEGKQVLGERGAIQIQGQDQIQGQGQDIQIDAQGNIRVDGKQIDTLRVVDFADKAGLLKEGESLYSGNGAVALDPEQVKVLQGCQEQSNVNSVLEMVNMITAMRSYEANQKAIQAEDQLLDKAVNEVGRL